MPFLCYKNLLYIYYISIKAKNTTQFQKNQNFTCGCSIMISYIHLRLGQANLKYFCSGGKTAQKMSIYDGWIKYIAKRRGFNMAAYKIHYMRVDQK